MNSIANSCNLQGSILHGAQLQSKVSQVKTQQHAHELHPLWMVSRLQSKLLHLHGGQWHTTLLQSPALNSKIFHHSYSTSKKARQLFPYQNFESKLEQSTNFIKKTAS